VDGDQVLTCTCEWMVMMQLIETFHLADDSERLDNLEVDCWSQDTWALVGGEWLDFDFL